MLPAAGEPPPSGPPRTGFLTLLRFRDDDIASLMADLRSSVALLATFAGFVDARIARAVDDGGMVVLVLAWDEVGSYRRALSSFDVKANVVPLLSRALDEPSAFEVLHLRDADGAIDDAGALAADANTVSLGDAASGFVPPAPS